MSLLSNLLESPGALVEADRGTEEENNFCIDSGWTDGLPVISPTVHRVRKMLAYYERPLEEVIGRIPPRYGEATPLRLAANAVMAGCLPELFPALVLAVEAMCAKEFNLYAMQTTTHCCAPLVLLNGPVARELGLDSGHRAFGPGCRANVTLGRALRLVLINIGGAIPGQGDMATYGSPAKLSYCTAENEAASPWEPMHVERGHEPEWSSVTVFAAEGPHNISDHASSSGEGILRTIAGTAATTGANGVYHPTAEPLILICPEHAATLKADGFSKNDIKQFLFEHTRIPMKNFSRENIQERLKVKYGDRYREAGPDTLIPIAQQADRFVIAVVGGAGKHSVYIPSFGNTTSVTRVFRNARGQPIRSIQELRSSSGSE
jgi:hypothetical protein